MRARVARFLPVAPLAAIATISSTSLGYRTLADTEEFADAAADSIVWGELPAHYVLHDDLPDNLGKPAVQAAVVAAMAAWESTDCALVSTSNDGWSSEGAILGDGLNTISWVHDDWQHDPEAGAFTDLLVEKRNGKWVIVEADVLLNAADHDWSISAAGPETKGLQSILLHEFGHFLGLTHPCAETACSGSCQGQTDLPVCASDPDHDDVVMNPVYDEARVTLADDDQQGLCALYPRVDCNEAGCPEGFDCIDADCHARCGDDICGASEVCAPAGCVSPGCDEGTCPCESDDDCRPGERCSIDGTCKTDAPPAGSSCKTDDDCVSSFCNANGECAVELLSFGESCSNASDCSSGECLTGSVRGNVCTQQCEDSIPSACPSGWECSAVGEQNVCTPLQLRGGSCSVVSSSPTNDGRHGFAIAVIGFFFSMALRRRALRATQRPSPRLS